MGNYWYNNANTSNCALSFLTPLTEFVNSYHSQEELTNALAALQEAEKKLKSAQSHLDANSHIRVETKNDTSTSVNQIDSSFTFVNKVDSNSTITVPVSSTTHTPEFLTELHDYFEKKVVLKHVSPQGTQKKKKQHIEDRESANLVNSIGERREGGIANILRLALIRRRTEMNNKEKQD